MRSLFTSSSIVSGLFVGFILLTSCSKNPPVDFSTQIKPILNDKCIRCHGGVKKQSGFSFLFENEAFSKLESGKFGISPGHPKRSEMIRRITSQDPDMRMPFEEKPLSEEEIDLLTRWIKEGANWGKHWAYEPVDKVIVPIVNGNWGKTDIDPFILKVLDQNDLKPSPPAKPAVLARRVSLDLIGLPTPVPIGEDFLSNPSEEEYERLVDRLISSPHYGEKWTSMWLDLARYADTKGYERDPERQIWRYRDWLIRAFNSDKPYDEFITEQLAGDLLPNPTDDQYLATAFHRNTMTNDEGGTDNEEFRVAAVLDRVNTTWEAIMSTSFACTQCHSHPYDPFKHEEYYQFVAFFNNSRDEDTAEDYPLLRHYNKIEVKMLEDVGLWVKEKGSKNETEEVTRFLKTFAPARYSLSTDQFVNAELSDTKWLSMRNNSSARLKNVQLDGKDKLLLRYRAMKPGGVLTFHLDDVNGKKLAKFLIPEKRKEQDWMHVELDIPFVNGNHDVYFSYENRRLDEPDEKGITFDWFYFKAELPGHEMAGFSEIKEKYWKLLKAQVPTTPVMVENPVELSRNTHLFERGSWLSPGDKVEPGVPESMHSFPENAPANRLGLAQWITSTDNPLTARTIVNHIWEQLFGRGLVETLEDLGTQGEKPSHPELLDYLSWQLMHEFDWSLKRLIKEIVMSGVYRQSSEMNTEHQARDPLNKYFARMPRIRLSAEQIRDQALFVSGAFMDDLYGPPSMPFQPEGVWAAPYDNSKWEMSKGEEKYRRALYTYWKRTSPYPSMMAFDGVGREFCSSRRIRTNTPLQALVTLNDDVYIDLSKKLTAKVWSDDIGIMITRAYENATLRDITDERLSALMSLYEEAYEKYNLDNNLAMEMCQGVDTDDYAEFAAMVLVSNSILNLDEVITKS